MYRSDPPRRVGVRCVLLLELRGERDRREIAEARMRPHRIEVLPPRFDQHLRLGARAEPFEAQALVAELAVEAFRRAILPGLARIDQCGGDALVDDPRQQCARDELRSVVRAQIEWRAALRHQPRQHLDHAAASGCGRRPRSQDPPWSIRR